MATGGHALDLRQCLGCYSGDFRQIVMRAGLKSAIDCGAQRQSHSRNVH